MKKIIPALLLMLVCFAANAQDTTAYTSAISVRYGGAIPMGSFKSDDFEEEYPPFAMAGSLLQVSYSRSITENLRAGGTLSLRRNKFNLDEFAKPNDELVLSRESKPWQSGFVLADVQYQWILLTKILYLRGSVGAAFNKRALVQVQTPYGTIHHEADGAVSLAYGLHLGLEESYGRWSIGIEAGILTTKPTFEITDAQGNQTRYKQGMTTLDTSISAAYAF